MTSHLSFLSLILFILSIVMPFKSIAHAAGNKCSSIFSYQKMTKMQAWDFEFDNKVRHLVKIGALEIPTQDGFIAAAEVGGHHGNYGRFFWFRDIARVFQGLMRAPELYVGKAQARALEKRREVALALVKIIEDPHLQEQALANIRNPLLHLDEAHGFNSVIWIRRMIEPFKERRSSTVDELKEEADWGHKQNDALAALGHSLLDALAKDVLKPSDLTPQARVNFLLLSSYFVQLKFWKMWDVGAWEESMGLRTSSVGLVTSLLERVKDGLYTEGLGTQGGEGPFFSEISKQWDSLFSQWHGETRDTIKGSLGLKSLDHAIAQGTSLVRQRLGLDSEGSVFEVQNGPHGEARAQDVALLHLLWHPMKSLSLLDQLYLISKLKVLEREKGYIRYVGDQFLRGARAAEWTLTDADLVSFYSETYLKTKKNQYLQKAKYHAKRMLSQLTMAGAKTIEGEEMRPGIFPEAFVPVLENGNIVYKVSPNSPLNWTIANVIRAIATLNQAINLNQQLLLHQ
ncbi:MAG: hypothetical protein KDD33_00940 [Bdellovibrionales bacterium]|nr:hypothetical protein [Bdellovibrionales bacterium]